MSTKIKDKTELGGMLGEKVGVTKVNGRVVLSNRPKRKMGPLTAKQIDVKETFNDAADYASDQVNDPEMNALYKTGINEKKTSAYMVAMTDYLTAPKVKLINTRLYRGNVGDPIVVTAYDDFKVVSVTVTINGPDGTMLEEGEAIQLKAPRSRWTYTSTVANPSVPGSTIKAVAVDMPGNETSADIML